MSAYQLIETETTSESNPFLKLHGFKYNPFDDLHTEEILETASIDYSTLLSYFVDPEWDLLHKLCERKHTVVTGQSGAGKTMLRHALAADIDVELQDVLRVTYEITSYSNSISWNYLNRALAVDLITTILATAESKIKRLDNSDLVRIAHYIEHTGLTSSIQKQYRLLQSQAVFEEKDYQAIWHRPVLRLPLPTESLLGFLRDLDALLVNLASTRKDEAEIWQDGLDLVTKLGFSDIFILIDVQHKSTSKSTNSSALQLASTVNEIIKKISDTKALNTYFKLFLPLDFSKKLHIPKETTHLKIQWHEDSLESLLVSRMRTAGARYRDIASLAEPAVAASLRAELATAKAHTPHSLLSRLKKLILLHQEDNASLPYLTMSDWERLTT